MELSSLSSFYRVQAPAHRRVLPIFRVGLSMSIDLVKRTPNIHAWRLTWTIPNKQVWKLVS